MIVIEPFAQFERSLRNSWVLTYADSDYWKVLSILKFDAAYMKTTVFHNGRLVELMPGEVLFTRNHWSTMTRISEGKLRVILDALEKGSFITRRSVGNAYTIIKLKWCANQSEGVVCPSDAEQPTNRPINQPKKRPANNQRKIAQQLCSIEFTTNEATNKGTNESANKTANGEPTIYKNVKKLRILKNNIYSSLVDQFTDNADLKDALAGFIDMRSKIKKPLTERAFQNILTKLSSYSEDITSQIAILDKSTENCWQGIFPLPKDEVMSNAKSRSGYDKSKILYTGSGKDYRDINV